MLALYSVNKAVLLLLIDIKKDKRLSTNIQQNRERKFTVTIDVLPMIPKTSKNKNIFDI